MNTEVKQPRPTFERRHYRKIAEVINSVAFGNIISPPQRECACGGNLDAIEYVSKLMAAMFKMDNPNFNQEKWEKAVYLYA